MKRTQPNLEGQSPEFARLVSWGCNDLTLSSLIKQVRAAAPDPSPLETLGGSQREIRSKLATIRKAASDIEGLMGTFAGNMATLFTGPWPYPDLPRLIRSFADQFEGVALARPVPDSRDRPPAVTQPSEDVPRAILCGYVFFATGDYHDREVSGVLGIPDVDTHRRWRERHKHFIKLFSKRFSPQAPETP
jgi:hypothetical protein